MTPFYKRKPKFVNEIFILDEINNCFIGAVR